MNSRGIGGAEGAGRSSGGWWERSSVSYWSREVVVGDDVGRVWLRTEAR